MSLDVRIDTQTNRVGIGESCTVECEGLLCCGGRHLSCACAHARDVRGARAHCACACASHARVCLRQACAYFDPELTTRRHLERAYVVRAVPTLCRCGRCPGSRRACSPDRICRWCDVGGFKVQPADGDVVGRACWLVGLIEQRDRYCCRIHKERIM